MDDFDVKEGNHSDNNKQGHGHQTDFMKSSRTINSYNFVKNNEDWISSRREDRSGKSGSSDSYRFNSIKDGCNAHSVVYNYNHNHAGCASFDKEAQSSRRETLQTSYDKYLEDIDGVPIVKKKWLDVMPATVGKQRLMKPLKTGIVAKKPRLSEEDDGSQENLDSWERYLHEVQQYKSYNLIEDVKEGNLK